MVLSLSVTSKNFNSSQLLSVFCSLTVVGIIGFSLSFLIYDQKMNIEDYIES